LGPRQTTASSPLLNRKPTDIMLRFSSTNTGDQPLRLWCTCRRVGFSSEPSGRKQSPAPPERPWWWAARGRKCPRQAAPPDGTGWGTGPAGHSPCSCRRHPFRTVPEEERVCFSFYTHSGQWAPESCAWRTTCARARAPRKRRGACPPRRRTPSGWGSRRSPRRRPRGRCPCPDSSRAHFQVGRTWFAEQNKGRTKRYILLNTLGTASHLLWSFLFFISYMIISVRNFTVSGLWINKSTISWNWKQKFTVFKSSESIMENYAKFSNLYCE